MINATLFDNVISLIYRVLIIIIVHIVGLSQKDTPELVFPRYTDFEVAQTLIEAIEIKAKSLGPMAAEEFDENAEESSDDEDGGEQNANSEREEAGDNSDNGGDQSENEEGEYYHEEEEEEEARLINRKKIVEEDDEFEKAFRSVMMVSCFLQLILKEYIIKN